MRLDCYCDDPWPRARPIHIIGAIGNGPLAAVLWENEVMFAGIIDFLYADYVVIPSLHINATCCGWRFAAYLGAVFTASAVGAGIIMRALFWPLGLIPKQKAGRGEELEQSRSITRFSRASLQSRSRQRSSGSTSAYGWRIGSQST